LGKRLQVWLRDELATQVPRLVLWRPVAFGAGAAVYFGRPAEPPIWTVGLCAAVIGTIFVALRLWVAPAGLAGGMILGAFAMAGFAASEIWTTLVDFPIVPVNLGVVEV
jgi:competence protein ComEC